MLSIITAFSSLKPSLSLEGISSSYRVLKKKKLEFHETSDHIGILKYFQHIKCSDNNSLSAALQNANKIEFKNILRMVQSKSVIHIYEEK